MPNRILKESICTSPTIDKLNPTEEAFFYRIIVNCDDFGRMEASPKIIRARCFPLRIDSVSDVNIIDWLGALGQSGLIRVYSVDGRQFIQVTTWDKHQQIRAKRSKYPEPSNNQDMPQADASIGNHLQSIDNISNHQQVKSIDSICPRNPIQSESNPIQSESNPAIKKSPFGEDMKVLFGQLDKARGFKTTKRQAEAASMLRMRKKGYTNEQILNTWIQLKAEPFYADKELFMMTVESQIGAKLSGKHQGNAKQGQGRSVRPVLKPEEYTDPADLYERNKPASQ